MPKKQNNIKKGNTKTIVFLLILFFTSIVLRSYNISYNLFFGPEQGVDFLKIKEIAVDLHPVLVGAKTDIGGVFHGPIYYYLSVLPFVISQGDPVFILYFFIVLNSASVFLIYLLGKDLFNKRVGLLSSILFT